MGLTVASKAAALATVLPNGTAAYVGFFTTLPSDDVPTGGVESSGSGYARVSHSAWSSATVGDDSYRVNTGAIEFTALTADLTNVNGWGIWDGSGGGATLIAFGYIRDVGGNILTNHTFTSGNQPRFVSGELQVGLD